MLTFYKFLEIPSNTVDKITNIVSIGFIDIRYDTHAWQYLSES